MTQTTFCAKVYMIVHRFRENSWIYFYVETLVLKFLGNEGICIKILHKYKVYCFLIQYYLGNEAVSKSDEKRVRFWNQFELVKFVRRQVIERKAVKQILVSGMFFSSKTFQFWAKPEKKTRNEIALNFMKIIPHFQRHSSWKSFVGQKKKKWKVIK